MGHYAYLDENNIVTQVIVGRDEGEDGIDWEQYYGAVRTSYNTRGGVHYGPDEKPSADQSKAFRWNYAGIGMIFHPDLGEDGAFIEPQPYPSWTLGDGYVWEPPIPAPQGQYAWSESDLQWVPAPSPFPSWTWDDEQGMWLPPVPYPEDGNIYVWDEEDQRWVPVPDQTLPTNP